LSSPIDAAFSVLKPEEEVRKILPLIIPAAAAIYGGYRGAKNVRENRITDPVLGVVSREGDDSALSNLAEFGTGFAQGFVPGKAAKAGARAGARKVAARSSAKASGRKAQREAVERQTGDAALARRLHPDKALQPRRTMSERALTGLGQPMGRLAPAVVAGAGLAYGGKQIADALGNMSMGGSGTAAPSGSGMGGGQQQQQGQFSLAGDPSGGVGNIQNVGVGQTGREQIWQQGGSGTFKQKGETMTFTHYEGNEMLRKTLEDLDKMHCATAKADCPKCGEDCKCDEKRKADDGDKKKKPAHGMVIVIGSKNAGPGPSTDGKRDSKD